jgi:hypothetical protein
MFAGLTRRDRCLEKAGAMTDADYERKLDELDHLLNDPDAPLQPERVWSLLVEVARHDLAPAEPQTA